MNIHEVLRALFPSVDPWTSWLVQDDGDGPYIAAWHLDAPQPTPEELAAAAPAAALAETRRAKLAAANARYSQVLGVIRHQYPQDEREGWPEQVQSAIAHQAGQDAPLVAALAAARGVTADAMATLILAKRDAYRALYGAATGRLGAIRDAIAAAEDQATLDAIDPDAGWPDPLAA